MAINKREDMPKPTMTLDEAKILLEELVKKFTDATLQHALICALPDSAYVSDTDGKTMTICSLGGVASDLGGALAGSLVELGRQGEDTDGFFKKVLRTAVTEVEAKNLDPGLKQAVLTGMLMRATGHAENDDDSPFTTRTSTTRH